MAHFNKNEVLLKTFVPSDSSFYWGRRGIDRMIVGFTTTNTISAYHH